MNTHEIGINMTLSEVEEYVLSSDVIMFQLEHGVQLAMDSGNGFGTYEETRDYFIEEYVKYLYKTIPIADAIYEFMMENVFSTLNTNELPEDCHEIIWHNIYRYITEDFLSNEEILERFFDGCCSDQEESNDTEME